MRVEITGTIPADFARVRAVLLDLEGFGGWFPALDAWRVLQRRSDSARVYGRQGAPWPVSDRDYVVEYRWWEAPDGAFVLEARGQQDAEPAPPDGVVRIADLRSEWRIDPSGGETRARYVYEGAVGPLPDWIDRVTWRNRTGALIDALAAEVARRSAAPDAP